MNQDLPYNYLLRGNEYRFKTEKGLFYSLKFFNGSIYFSNLPVHIPVFEVNITNISLGEHISPPKDPRIEATIVEIFRVFFLEHENSIVYICNNLDKKQAVRHRKFNMWFSNAEEQNLEKYDTHFIVAEIEIYASLILHSSNAFKAQLISAFLNQSKEYEKDSD